VLAPSQEFNRAYGFLFWLNGQTPAMDALNNPKEGELVPFAPDDLFAARGFGNQFIDVIPSLDLVVVRFGADPATDFDPQALADDARFDQHDDILRPILEGIAP
jgi:CubicO group peptidase (beta-lactamase class C family)